MNTKQPTAAQSVTNLVSTLQRAMVRKVELLDELEHVNKTISGLREGLQGVKLGETMANDAHAERAKREEADRAAHKSAEDERYARCDTLKPTDISN